LSDSRHYRVLVIDDQPELLELVTKYLTMLGYEVVAETDPDVALRQFREAAPPIDAIIADLHLAGRSGAAVLAEAVRLRPGIAAVIYSGLSLSHLDLPAEIAGRVVLLEKPFLPRMLASALERALSLSAGPEA
jgi:CheY-like chemotaxis protein